MYLHNYVEYNYLYFVAIMCITKNRGESRGARGARPPKILKDAILLFFTEHMASVGETLLLYHVVTVVLIYSNSLFKKNYGGPLSRPLFLWCPLALLLV